MTEILLWSSFALLVYAYAGYPLLVRVLAAVRARPVLRSGQQLSVAVIVVAHNEAKRLPAKLQTLLAQDYPAHLMRVVVASDGSTDDTVSIARARTDARVTALAFPDRRGKAACLNDAVAACDEQVLVMNDARQMLAPDAVSRLLENFADPQVVAVSGELVFGQAGEGGYGQGVDAYWRYEKFIRRNEALLHSVPGVTGAIYAIRRSAFQPIPPDTILDDVEIPMMAMARQGRVVFDHRALAFDTPSHSPSQERLRKTRTLAGNFQLLSRHPSWMLPGGHPIWWQFLSHKVLRLLGPWAMLVAFVANLALLAGGGFYALLFAAQCVFYTAAVVGLAVPPALRWRVVRLAAAFVSLNWFAALGLYEFVSNRQAHLWRSAGAGGKAANL